jgi:phosphomannomutase
MLVAAVSAGLMSAGRNVVRLGVCPTPTVLHHVRTHGLAGGIVVTASHNPEEWNGLKFIGPGGRFLSPDEFGRFRAGVEDGVGFAAPWSGVGLGQTYATAAQDHVGAVADHPLFASRAAGLKVGVDAVNGAASAAGPLLVEALGATPHAVNCDAAPERLLEGFPRRPEPTPEHLEDLSHLVRERKLDLGIAFDPDADRVGLVDETGTPLSEELTLCLACLYLLPKLGQGVADTGTETPPVVVNLSTTRAVEDVCARANIRVERTPVGEAAVVARMLETDSLLGGEGNGGVILPAINSTRDGMVAAASAMALVASSGSKLSEIASSVPRYRSAKLSVPLSRAEFSRAAERLTGLLPEAKVDRQDGLRFDTPAGWVHVRPSNTEPIVRIMVESADEDPSILAGMVREALTGKGTT